MEQDNLEILKFKKDRYDAATISEDHLPTDPAQFDKMLNATMIHFTSAKIRGVWLKISKEKCALIPIAAKYGFKYHHAKKDYVLMQHWIPKDEINKLPHYASHFTGAGGVVINEETDEILVIQEKKSVVEDMWKVPGGLIDDNEYIYQAVEREVFEETGIKAEFQSLLCFREKLGYKWNAPDLYFVCLLKPTTFEIQHDPREILVAKWMKIDEYLKLPNMLETQKRVAEVVRLYKTQGVSDLKNIGKDILYDLAGHSVEEFDMQLGSKIIPKNAFYGPIVSKEFREAKV